MGEPSEKLREIEEQLDAGTYRPGPWTEFLEAAGRHSREDRLAISDHVSRVSDKLHLRGGPRTFSFQGGLAAEVLAALGGLVLLALGLERASVVLVATATLILTVTFQPLVKTSVGQVLGIRYSYSYLSRLEPRFKMRYGTYLGSERWRRVLFHSSGAVGSPLALWLSSSLTARDLESFSLVCAVLFAIAVAAQVGLFILAPLASIVSDRSVS